MKVLYLDESGNHDLRTIIAGHSAFVLGGVLIDRQYARTHLEQSVRDFKQRWFGNDQIVLHSMDILQAKKEFSNLRLNPDYRNRFMDDLKLLLTSLEYEVIACLIHKDLFTARGMTDQDLYHVGLEVVVEKFCAELGDVEDGGIIYAEKRRPDHDHNLDIAWESLREFGSDHLESGQIDKRIVGMSLKAKSVNIAGLQLADLVVSTISRHAMGRDSREFYGVIEAKMCQRNGQVEGHGLVTLPSLDKK